jgi:hypothetical protein
MNSQKRKAEAQASAVSGYIHAVSPMKKSKSDTKYFDASLQTADGVRRMVIFSPEKHKEMKMMSGTSFPAVTLENYKVADSNENLLLNYKSKLSPGVTVNFKRSEEPEAEIVALKDLLSNFENKKIVSIVQSIHLVRKYFKTCNKTSLTIFKLYIKLPKYHFD